MSGSDSIAPPVKASAGLRSESWSPVAGRCGAAALPGNVRHILVVPSWYSDGRGSGGGYFRDQALALAAAGYRVAILAPSVHTLRDLHRPARPGPGGRISVENDGLPVYRRSFFVAMPRLPYRNALAFALCGLRLANHYIRDHGRPDLVHAHGSLNAGVLAAALARRRGIPFIVTEHTDGFGQGRLRPWERRLIGRVAARARRRTAVSPHLAAVLEQQYPGSSWQYLPNVLGAAFVAQPSPARSASSPLPRQSARPFVFLCVARMSPEKGHALLLDAFARAFGGVREVRLQLVGDGPCRAAIEEAGVRLGIAGQVDFAGVLPAEQVREALRGADAFVLASTVETFGVVVIEALACGLPVVCTASGGPNHLIDPANGILVPPADTQALGDALIVMRGRAATYDRAAIGAAAIRDYGPAAFACRFAAMIA